MMRLALMVPRSRCGLPMSHSWRCISLSTFSRQSDHYGTLGVKRDATTAQIKSAYLQLAKKYHPDVNSSPEATDKFKKLAEAYQVLSNPDERRQYDMFGSSGGAYQQQQQWRSSTSNTGRQQRPQQQYRYESSFSDKEAEELFRRIFEEFFRDKNFEDLRHGRRVQFNQRDFFRHSSSSRNPQEQIDEFLRDFLKTTSSFSSPRNDPRRGLIPSCEMSKGTTIKEALAKWEEKTGEKAAEAKEVKLYCQLPMIEKMDASLSTLVNCEKLSLSTNSIEKIANLNGLKNLKILSLGRNNIKSLSGLEAVGDTLMELWISYNFIEKLKGIGVLKKLKVLYMSNNSVKDWGEFSKLQDLPVLEDLLMVGNPLQEKHDADGDWRDLATKKLPKLKKLDGVPVVREEEEEEG